MAKDQTTTKWQVVVGVPYMHHERQIDGKGRLEGPTKGGLLSEPGSVI